MAAGRFAYLLDREDWLGRLMISPAVLYIAAIIGLPFLLTLSYSVSDITVGSTSLNFVSLKNFKQIFSTPAFRVAVKITFIFAFAPQAIVLVLAKTLALLLLKDFRGKWVVRGLIMLPWVAPISLGAIGWMWILDSIYSIINWRLRAVGIFGPDTWPM